MGFKLERIEASIVRGMEAAVRFKESCGCGSCV